MREGHEKEEVTPRLWTTLVQHMYSISNLSEHLRTPSFLDLAIVR